MKVDPKSLQPGMFVAHRDGAVCQLLRRKEDDSGWWMTDRSGLVDSAWDSGAWKALDKATVRRLWEATDA